jgi:CubicO group peptidase (beta-lactamase class C family)
MVQQGLDFSHEADPTRAGMKPARVQRIVEQFESMLKEKQWHPAAQLVVLRRGHVVVDRAIGRGRDGERIDHDTPFYTFSVSKPLMAICIHKLIEDGKIDLDERISAYWPEFGCRGKETATVRHVLLHQGGIPAPHLYWQVPLWPQWKWVTRAVAGYKAVYPPGQVTHYHLLNYGFILGEIVRRVTGEMPDGYFETRFLEPMGLRNTWMRIPVKEIKRTAKIFSYHKEHTLNAKVFNLKVVRHALLPAASIHSNARELAAIYQMLLNEGEYAGKRFLKPETIRLAVCSGYHGYEVNENGIENIALGFFLGGKDVFLRDSQKREYPYYGKGSSEKTFGHYGLGSGMTWADPAAGLVVAFTTNGLWNNDITHLRWKMINDAVWDAIE